MLWRSPSGASCPARKAASFSAGTLSPVSALSSHLRLAVEMSRRSAGTTPARRPAAPRRRAPDRARAPVPRRLEKRGDRRAHLPQGLQRGLRLALLHDADDGVHHHDDEDDAGLGPFLQQRRKSGRHQQDEHHGVAQLLAHHGGKRSWAAWRKASWGRARPAARPPVRPRGRRARSPRAASTSSALRASSKEGRKARLRMQARKRRRMRSRSRPRLAGSHVGEWGLPWWSFRCGRSRVGRAILHHTRRAGPSIEQ